MDHTTEQHQKSQPGSDRDASDHGSSDHGSSDHGSSDRALSVDDARTRVVVIGGGLAGLTAAIVAARGGAAVTVLDTRRIGGRAATTVVDPGVVFNGGPRAFYAGGPGRSVLEELDIHPLGASPDTSTGRVVRDGVLHPLLGRPVSLLRTQLLSSRSKFAAAKLLGRLGSLEPEAVAGRSVTQWMGDRRFAQDLRELLAMLIRTSTYCSDLDSLSADAAVGQLQHALGEGVRYLDGGFQQIVDALAGAASAAGVQVVDHTRVSEVAAAAPTERALGRWAIRSASGVVHADAVVLACGGPESIASLSPVPLDLSGLGPAATAACLELAVRGPIPQPILLGCGEPLYLSVHQPPADLAPAGISVVHAMRYGARSGPEDSDQLWNLAAIGGITPDEVVAHRFLHRMVVTGGTPIASAGGMVGRPAVRVRGTEGLFLAGDWVGPVGMLADGSLVSGREAGTAAAAVPAAHGRTSATACSVTR